MTASVLFWSEWTLTTLFPALVLLGFFEFLVQRTGDKLLKLASYTLTYLLTLAISLRVQAIFDPISILDVNGTNYEIALFGVWVLVLGIAVNAGVSTFTSRLVRAGHF